LRSVVHTGKYVPQAFIYYHKNVIDKPVTSITLYDCLWIMFYGFLPSVSAVVAKTV